MKNLVNCETAVAGDRLDSALVESNDSEIVSDLVVGLTFDQTAWL